MTDPANPPPSTQSPEAPSPLELGYQTPPPWGSAPLLVRLAAIFTFITTGLSLLHAIVAGGMIVLIVYALPRIMAAAPPPPPGVVRPVLPSPWTFGFLYGGAGALSLLVIPFKLVGASKLLRRGRNAWGWGLAVGIIQCAELWQVEPCCVSFVLPVGVGVYTIIILCRSQVRQYLQFGSGDRWVSSSRGA